MVSFFAELKMFRFWPKTMDYIQSGVLIKLEVIFCLASFTPCLKMLYYMKLKFAPFWSS